MGRVRRWRVVILFLPTLTVLSVSAEGPDDAEGRVSVGRRLCRRWDAVERRWRVRTNTLVDAVVGHTLGRNPETHNFDGYPRTPPSPLMVKKNPPAVECRRVLRGADGNRNHDLFDANEALYQLSYSPVSGDCSSRQLTKV